MAKIGLMTIIKIVVLALLSELNMLDNCIVLCEAHGHIVVQYCNNCFDKGEHWLTFTNVFEYYH